MRVRGVLSAIEDYLKAIYDLGAHNVKTQELAATLSVSAASVSGMLKKLFELKLTVRSIPNPLLRIESAQPTVHSFEGDL